MSVPEPGSRVLVTGGSGYVAGWCIVEVLRAGFTVRATLRDPDKGERLRASLAEHGVRTDPAALEFVRAELLEDDGWAEAMSGCSAVLHVASPLTATSVEDEVIRPAVEGTLRVLRAAREAGISRVVYTSSCGAVYYGHAPRSTPFDESDWTDVDGGPMSAYVKSKALAERAAWDWVAATPGAPELVVVNPAGIFGPPPHPGALSSLGIIARLVEGMPGIPDLRMGIVDVRDVARLHVLALLSPAAAGQRYIAWSEGTIPLAAVALTLREGLGEAGARVPRRRLPSPLVRLAARRDQAIADIVPLLGERRAATSTKARSELGWRPRRWQETIVDSGRALTTKR